MCAMRLSDAFDQLQQLYALRELHQTLIARLQYYQNQHDQQMAMQRGLLSGLQDDDDEMPNQARFLFTLGGAQQQMAHMPQNLEQLMMMRAIQMSLETVQPSSAPPPIAKDDASALTKVLITSKFLQKLPAECDDCVICQESFRSMIGAEVVRLPCDHFFCEDCVGQWLRTSRTCPVCRTELVHVSKMYADSSTKKSRLLPVTPPTTSLPPVGRQNGADFRRLEERAEPSAPTAATANPYSNPPVGSGVGSSAPTAAEQQRIQRQNDAAERAREQAEQAALLEEIMTNRDTRQATIAPAQRAPQPPTPARPMATQPATRSSEPVLSTVRRSSSNSTAPLPPSAQPAPRRTPAQLSVGRPRVSVSNTGVVRSEAAASNTGSVHTGSSVASNGGTIRTGSVGVRGVLNSRRAS